MLKNSIWEIGGNKSYPTLAENIEVDVAIIGAGITGIFNAYILSNAGLKVAVLEKETNILQNTTSYTTAFITKVIDTQFYELVNLFGDEKAKLIWRSGEDAINLIAGIVKAEKIDCDFELVSLYTYATSEKEFEKLTEEYTALQKSDIHATLDKDSKKLGFKNSGFLEIPVQAKFHPIKFSQALAQFAESKGAKIYTNSEVLAVDGTIVKTKNFNIRAKEILVATYSPLIHEGTRFKKAAYKSYVCELNIAKNLIPGGLYVDMGNPYHYFRIDSLEKFDRMIVGGEDHRKDIKISSQKNFNALLEYAKTVLEGNKHEIIRRWDGTILESVDGLPFIGNIKPHIFVATAFSGNGMTYSAISAFIIRDLILGKQNPYSSLYNAKRVPSLKQLFIKSLDYGGEFFGGVVKNLFLSKYKI